MYAKIEQIKKALEHELYLPALALALTLPDICGKVYMPDEKYVGERYKAWFDKYVACHFADERKDYTDYFNGYMCYKLRCAFLHSGNSDIPDFGGTEIEDDDYTYHFDLCINETTTFPIKWTTDDEDKTIKHKGMKINIEFLCKWICSGAIAFYTKKRGIGFEEHNLNIIDLEKDHDKLLQAISQHDTQQVFDLISKEKEQNDTVKVNVKVEQTDHKPITVNVSKDTTKK